MQNLRGRNPLKSDYNGIVVGKNNVNSYSVKVNGSNVVLETELVCAKFYHLFQSIIWMVCRTWALSRVFQVLRVQGAGTWQGTRPDLQAIFKEQVTVPDVGYRKRLRQRRQRSVLGQKCLIRAF